MKGSFFLLVTMASMVAFAIGIPLPEICIGYKVD